MNNQLTKEEILGLSFYPHECGSMIDCVTKNDALKAMDEYAKQEAIEFCQDVLNNIDVNGVRIIDYKEIDGQQLYELYLKSKNTDK